MNLDGIGFVEAIVVDVSDLAKGAAFWGAVTGKEFGPSFEPNFLRARLESGLDLVLQEVADFKTSKNRMHLDIEVTDIEIALESVTAIGGSLVARADNEFGGLIVCADPDGNEFCLTCPNS